MTAVVESIDEPAVLFGHSYGDLRALEAVPRTADLRALARANRRLPGRSPARTSPLHSDGSGRLRSPWRRCLFGSSRPAMDGHFGGGEPDSSSRSRGSRIGPLEERSLRARRRNTVIDGSITVGPLNRYYGMRYRSTKSRYRYSESGNRNYPVPSIRVGTATPVVTIVIVPPSSHRSASEGRRNPGRYPPHAWGRWRNGGFLRYPPPQ